MISLQFLIRNDWRSILIYLDSQGGKFPYAEVAGAIESLGCKHVETTVSEGLSVSIDKYTITSIKFRPNSIIRLSRPSLTFIMILCNGIKQAPRSGHSKS